MQTTETLPPTAFEPENTTTAQEDKVDKVVTEMAPSTVHEPEKTTTLEEPKGIKETLPTIIFEIEQNFLLNHKNFELLSKIYIIMNRVILRLNDTIIL